MTSGKSTTVGRRNLFRAFGIASAAVATAVVAPITARTAQAYDPGDEETRSRYQPDSPDVQAFYRTNGYETLKK